jgi:hypothetical protein
MVNSVRSWPEYQEIREIVQNMFADAQQITKLAWDVYMRGNVFNNLKRNRNPLCFVLTCIKFYDTEQYIDKIFQNDKYLEFIIWEETVLALLAKQCS